MEQNTMTAQAEVAAPIVSDPYYQDPGMYGANLYSGGAGYNYYSNEMPASYYSGHLFVWLTITMLWVLMILAIMALFKYVTHDERKPLVRAKGSK